MTKNNSSFVDTDIIMKLGNFNNGVYLASVLKSYNYELYLHEYLLSEELIYGEHAIKLLKQMISSAELNVMKVSDLTPQQLIEYNSTLDLLAREMNVDLTKPRDRNAGEVRSMAMAFILNFQYFISDDRGARVAANKHLQNLDGTCLETIRMNDIIVHIKANQVTLGIDRKTAKNLYIYGANKKLGRNEQEKRELEEKRERLKKEFDEILWPL